MEIDVKNLHPLEVRLLRHVALGEPITAGRIVDELGYKVGQCNQAFSWLSAKGYLVEKSRESRVLYELTEFGREQAEKGTPAQRIFAFIKAEGPHALPEIASALSLDKSEVGSAFGQLSKAHCVRMNDENKAQSIADELSGEFLLTANLLQKGLKGDLDESALDADEKKAMGRIAKKRGAASSPFKVIEREEIVYELTEEGAQAKEAVLKANITGEELGSLTPEMLASGSWKEGTFRPYGLNAPTSRLIPGRHNPYGNYLQWVKDKLCSLGFEEFDGSLVENEFWNGDALFMPQFHSARDIHDVYYIKDPVHCKEIEEPWLSQVAKTHEDGWKTGSRGWRYKFDHEFTRRQVLRSQGTVLSARQLPKAKIPGKYFGVARCFRYDQVDATHGADFYQTEGIVLGNDVNLKTLLGLLKMFAEEIAGAEEVKYVPGYFPFTEPSIEVHIKHPVLGWFELGGSGIFRPEVTKALGIDVPVLAWGLGIDRMALMHLGLNDLRELFTPNIESVRTRRGN
ncbi:phenylalanine--tRNA ligase subunit alpha [Sphaerochaeta halotolerans]|jgi:phenylalanyl-tRNA synthetase alpha chain|uniref:phenylalanine--tRNA ligase subunit alpha n=1 Tax=Sphaerochaeta halotolerans TaxID=2293840 RepID=UPI00136B20B3|nr:phenylalanine--tRNA ligase subunit alpha [Sphaerochaeta halotolerans]MBG0768028.1 phenylalanine--tRNA ligase subunit alpha [Spirochaetaceae bacterium]MDK2860210.1 phenylalanyl-tRNA synthetase alpha chain [Sphaerochaeta sp.]MDN5334480.1 phenylalanyl-tRNA synthetase alpha chain [Sphaerochaeta sp.]MXI86737.1 phenylalanine--tRNA ligase subunit alpha [Sphaerochaeta halotolerans]